MRSGSGPTRFDGRHNSVTTTLSAAATANAACTLTTSAVPPSSAAAIGREPTNPTSHSAMIRPRNSSGARSCTTVLSPVIAQPNPRPARANPAIATAGTVPTASTAHPAPSPDNPIDDTRAEAIRPRISASTAIPTAAPMPKTADNVPTSRAPPPSSSASEGVNVIDGSDAIPTVVTAISASSSGRSCQTYLMAARTR